MSTEIKQKKRSRYIKKAPKPYQVWLNDHHEEVMKIPSQDRTEYVKSHLMSEVSVNMTSYQVYQLLYRNMMTDKKEPSMPKPKYIPKGPRPWKIWLNEHSAEFIHMSSNDRIDYVFNHLNADLNLNKSRYDIYQLLYRNNLLKPSEDHPDQVSDIHSDIHSDQNVKSIENNSDNSSEQEADNSAGQKSELDKVGVSSQNLLFTLSDMTSHIDSLSHSDINPSFIQDVTQRYMKILSRINADFAELNELKKELKEMI